MIAGILNEIRTGLTLAADETIRQSGLKFFKEPVNLYGVRNARVHDFYRKIAKQYRNLSKEEVFEICTELWKSGMLEESFIACDWAHAMRRQYKPGDIEVFEKWIKHYVNNWASCDTLCNHSVGSFIEKYPSAIQRLHLWALDENRWVKRAAAVSLIIPAKRGMFLPEIFTIATTMLRNTDDMVQKGVGWMLKVASQAHLNEVFNFVMVHKQDMPRTMLRYAIEKMPEEMRTRAMIR